MTDFSSTAQMDVVQIVIDVLKTANITSEIVANGEEAKKKVLEMIPKGSEVMTMSSITLQQTSITDAIDNSGDYDSVKKKLNSMNRETQGREMQKLGATPDWAVGSVHAVTMDGKVFIASNTGSQLPAYVYGAAHVIWVVGTQKIVKDEEEAKRRIYEYILPKESVRLRKQYSLPDTVNSNVSKLLMVEKEVTPNRIHIIFVNEALGF